MLNQRAINREKSRKEKYNFYNSLKIFTFIMQKSIPFSNYLPPFKFLTRFI